MRLLKPVCFISISIFLFFTNSSFAADVAKIGVIDLQKILATSAAGKHIQDELKKEKEKMEVNLQKRGTEIRHRN